MFPSETENETPTGYSSNNPGKGGSIIKPPKKSEEPDATPKGEKAKGSKDDGKDAKTAHAGKVDDKHSKSEEPGDAPSGVNDMEIPHIHLPELLHQKEGDEVHLHVYGKVKAHNMEKGKNHAVVEVKSVKRHGDEDQGPQTDTEKNMAKMPVDKLKGILMAQQNHKPEDTQAV